MNCKYQNIADTLCKLTEEVLWNSNNFSDVIVFNDFKLKTRIGCGMATYCKFNPKENAFTITYGKKMIESKFHLQQAKLWMTYREVLSRNYYNQDTSLVNILAHTVCHEFAHVIQLITKQAIKGSIHNTNFYSILDKIHLSNEANIIRDNLENYFSSNAISAEYIHESTLSDNKSASNLRIGSSVSFLHKKKVYSGQIVKINSKTVQVKVKKLLIASIWKVPKQCIEIYQE